MSLFKSNKNKTASAATTPAQTPRASLNEQRPETKMTQEQAIKMAMKKTVQTNVLNFNLMPLGCQLSSLSSQPTIQPAMSLFKSNKNKTSSAASTPAQTPRSSVDGQRPAQVKMTRDQALEMALRKSVQTMPANFSLM
ncbi:hypothetical protein F5H01DRAFT_379468 [Linnemannia elongata]|nr:hypothetical protein F5H01DRAFT_379468 [Linnemannia elongata]